MPIKTLYDCDGNVLGWHFMTLLVRHQKDPTYFKGIHPKDVLPTFVGCAYGIDVSILKSYQDILLRCYNEKMMVLSRRRKNLFIAKPDGTPLPKFRDLLMHYTKITGDAVPIPILKLDDIVF